MVLLLPRAETALVEHSVSSSSGMGHMGPECVKEKDPAQVPQFDRLKSEPVISFLCRSQKLVTVHPCIDYRHRIVCQKEYYVSS